MLSLFYVLLFGGISCAQELIANPDFEEPFGEDNWICTACTLDQVASDVFQGNYSGQVTARTDTFAGVSQYVSPNTNTNYYFFIHFKLLTMNTPSVSIRLNAAVQYTNGSEEVHFTIGEMPQYMIEQGWQKMGGDFYMDDRGVDSFRIYVEVDDASCDYLVDTASLTTFTLSATWKEEANERIDQIRKNDININLNLSSDYNPADIKVQLSQTKLAFPFGSAIVDSQIAGNSDYNQKYQDCYYSHYNWAVFENAMKWGRMEPNQYEITFPDESVSRLNQRGIPIRAHCMYWGKVWFVPNWLVPMTEAEIYTEMDRRNEYMVSRYADKVVHWDVNNEQLHGRFFEAATGNQWILSDMFKMITDMDPEAMLFTNDYEQINTGTMTQAAVNLIYRIENNGAQVGGMGLQAHIVGYPDINSIQKRLEIASAAGKPIWITELDVELEDREQRANGYDDIVTLYYADPNVHGVLMWGFSDLHHWRPNAALFEGEDFVPNAAGLRWEEMLGSRWRTNATFSPSSSEEIFGIRGFYGNYTIQVTDSGTVVHTETFITSDSPVTIDIAI